VYGWKQTTQKFNALKDIDYLQDFNMVKIESRPQTKQTLTKRWGNTTENMKAIYRE